METTELEKLERYCEDKLVKLRLKKVPRTEENANSWLDEHERHVMVLRHEGQYLTARLGLWRIHKETEWDEFCEKHVKPMIDELKRQEQEQEL